MEATNARRPQVRKNRGPWPARLVGIAVAFGVLALVVLASLPKPVEVELATAVRGEFRVTVDEDGITRVTDRYVISAPLSGNLARIDLEPGDEVHQGDVIGRLLPAKAPLLDTRSRSEAEARVAAALAGVHQAQAQAERARAARDFASQEADRTQKLAAQGTLSQQELERALLEKRSGEAELSSAVFAGKVAEHELAMARAALGRLDGKGDGADNFQVTSPVGGRVLKVVRESEGVVQAGAQLLEVGDPRALEIAVDVLTTDAVHIQPGAPVHIGEWGGNDLSGAVRRVEPSAFTRLSALGVEEQRVNVIIDLKSPYEEWRELGDGYRVEARIQVYRREDAVLVPWSALFRTAQGWALFVVDQDRAALRSIAIGRKNERMAEVESGLAQGEHVVVHPSYKVRPGVKLTWASEGQGPGAEP